jgi:hypothetical protein
MFVIAGFAGLLLTIAIFSGWQGTTRLTSRGDDTKAVEAAARAFVEAYGTFDFREPDAYRRRLLAVTGGAVREATLASGVDPVAVGQRRTITARVVAVSVSALSEDAAAASVTAEQVRKGVDVETGRLIEERVRQRVACRLAREGDRWLVVEFRLVSEEPLNPTPGARREGSPIGANQ